MTAVAGGVSSSVIASAIEQSAATETGEPAKLSQHLLVLLNTTHIIAHEKVFVQKLCMSLRKGLEGYDARFVLVAHTRTSNMVKKAFRETMAEYETKPEQAPFHATAYSPDIPMTHVRENLRGSCAALERGTEHEIGHHTTSKVDFSAFCHVTRPDVVAIAETIEEIQAMQRLSSSCFSTGGRRMKGLLWLDNEDGRMCVVEAMPARLMKAMKDPAELVTI